MSDPQSERTCYLSSERESDKKRSPSTKGSLPCGFEDWCLSSLRGRPHVFLNLADFGAVRMNLGWKHRYLACPGPWLDCRLSSGESLPLLPGALGKSAGFGIRVSRKIASPALFKNSFRFLFFSLSKNSRVHPSQARPQIPLPIQAPLLPLLDLRVFSQSLQVASLLHTNLSHLRATSGGNLLSFSPLPHMKLPGPAVRVRTMRTPFCAVRPVSLSSK